MALFVDIRKLLPHFELCTRFTCQPGRLTAVVGPSGSGKTTLIRLIAGLDAPDHGTITLEGHTWFDADAGLDLPTRHRRAGLVFQDYTLFPHMTIRRNIRFGAPDPDLADGLMERFGILHLAEERPRNVSGGERQRAAMCQALASQPRLLLLDEPFSALDTTTRTSLCTLLKDLTARLGIPVLHVTHDLREAEFLGDETIALERGRISCDWLTRQQPFNPTHRTHPEHPQLQRTIPC